MATPTKAPTPEEILEDGINDGRYANILDTINVNMDNPMLQCVIQFARDYHKEKLREELIDYIKWLEPHNIKEWPCDENIFVDEYLKAKP